MIDEVTIARALAQLLKAANAEKEVRHAIEEEGVEVAEALSRTQSYREAGMMTRDAGIVVYLEDESKFQVTVVRRR